MAAQDDRSEEATTGPPACAGCGAADAGPRHLCGALKLCENCYVERWRPHHRKPHWCYLGSIKGDYLRMGPED